MLAVNTTWWQMHRQLRESRGLDTISRGRLTRIEQQTRPLTSRDAVWLRSTWKRIQGGPMPTTTTDVPPRKIDEASEKLIFKARKKLKKMEVAQDEAQAIYKQAKAATEEAGAALCRLIDELQDPNLFKPETQEDWRKTTLEEMGMPEAIREKLAAHTPSIKTWGDIADFTSDEANTLRNIKGIGEKAEMQIQDCLDAWLEEHPQHTEEQAEAPN